MDMTRVCVDLEKCKLHGQCVIAAPAIFSFDNDGRLVWREHIAASERQPAEEAADVCPEQAITLED
jgi:ferredoxin